MTPNEIKTLLGELSERQRIDTIDQMAFAQIMAEHPAETVLPALARIRRTKPYVNPNDLDDALNATATTHIDHVMRLLADGRFNTQLNPADFPDQRSYQAARQASPAMRTAYAHQAKQIYLDAWRNQTNPRPALTVVRNELGEAS